MVLPVRRLASYAHDTAAPPFDRDVPRLVQHRPAYQGNRNRFIGVVDGMASLVPLAVVLVAVFGRSQLIDTPKRWEAAFLLIFITLVDLFGGYTFNIALSRRIMNVAPAAQA